MRLIQRDVDDAGWREARADGGVGRRRPHKPVGRRGRRCAWRSAGIRRAPSMSCASKCPDGRFPSVGALHAPAIRLERAVVDLYGFVAEGAQDDRPGSIMAAGP